MHDVHVRFYRNYALENAMEAANVPLMELMDRWGLYNAERMMVKADQLQLLALISRKGTTGEVWRGALWGQPVAVKLVPLAGVDDQQLDCLRREVCIYKGFCVKDGKFAIIMKLYNCSLAALVARHAGRRLPLPLALKFAGDITKGLVELHRLGVTAADLKPDNVLVDEELGDAVIADFGLSSVVMGSLAGSATVRAQSSQQARLGNTVGPYHHASNAVRGTPNYMAPEQFSSGQGITNKVDIWAFATTAPPLPPGLPVHLELLLSSCLQADPAKRPTAAHILKGKHQQLNTLQSSFKQDAGLNQYFQQLGLLPLITEHSQGGAPSAPPLPEAGSFGRLSSSSSGGCPGQNKLPRVLWSEEEAHQEEQVQQQQRFGWSCWGLSHFLIRYQRGWQLQCSRGMSAQPTMEDAAWQPGQEAAAAVADPNIAVYSPPRHGSQQQASNAAAAELREHLDAVDGQSWTAGSGTHLSPCLPASQRTGGSRAALGCKLPDKSPKSSRWRLLFGGSPTRGNLSSCAANKSSPVSGTVNTADRGSSHNPHGICSRSSDGLSGPLTCCPTLEGITGGARPHSWADSSHCSPDPAADKQHATQPQLLVVPLCSNAQPTAEIVSVVGHRGGSSCSAITTASLSSKGQEHAISGSGNTIKCPRGIADSAAVDALRASSCSPLRSHVRNLSLTKVGYSSIATPEMPASNIKDYFTGPHQAAAEPQAAKLETRAQQLTLSGKIMEATATLKSASALLAQHLGPSHPTSIAGLTRLAVHLNRHGSSSEAEQLLRQVLSHKQAMLGKRHPQVATASSNLAACLYLQGKYGAAAKMYRSALSVKQSALGEHHLDSAQLLHNLALCHSRLEQHAEAESLCRQAFTVRQAGLGAAHPDVAASAHQLGHCLSQLNRLSEALAFYKQGLWIRQHGTEHPARQGCSRSGEDILASQRSVGLCLAKLGCDQQAGEHLKAVWQARDQQLVHLGLRAAGESSRLVHSTLCNDTAAVMGVHAGDDVDWSTLAEGDTNLTEKQRESLLAAAAAADELGRCLSRQGMFSSAEELFWKALDARSRVLGCKHETVQKTEEQLRKCLEQQT
eukprot:gene7411-7620_t